MKDLLDFDLHIFDLDDTLINTRQSYFTAQEAALKEVFSHLPIDELTSCLSTIRWLCQVFGSGNVRQYMKAFLTCYPDLLSVSQDTLDSLLLTYQEKFWSTLRCPEARPFLQKLRVLKKPLSLVSNGITASQKTKLDSANLTGFFPDDVCFISGQFDSSKKKPSPFMINLAMEQAAVTPDKAVFYGNTVQDVLAGNLAGVFTVFLGDSAALPQNVPALAVPNMSFNHWRDLMQVL